MKATSIMLAVIALFLLGTGCEKEALLEVPDSNANLIEENLSSATTPCPMVPIKAEIYISVETYNELGLGTSGKIQGRVSHLGKLDEPGSYWENTSYDLSQFPVVGYINSTTLAAANGDLLKGTVSGTLNLQTGEGTAAMVFEGGTGRFTYASGGINGSGYTDFDPATGLLTGLSLEGEGEICYSGK